MKILIDIAALIIQIIGTLVMYFNTPNNRVPIYMFDETIPEKKNRNLRIGLIILCCGFILQLISLVLKTYGNFSLLQKSFAHQVLPVNPTLYLT